MSALTERERAVALLVAWGGANRDVAEALGISPRTVSRDLASVRRKLGMASRAELPARVSELGCSRRS